jgi:tetratricopeptide (TPR) repeat protein
MPGERKKRQEAVASPSRLSQLTRRQRLILGIVVLTTPVILLCLLEGGLRLGGYGSDFPLFVPYGSAAPDYLVPNPHVAYRFFPPSGDVPRPAVDVFRAAKPASALRLFVQGGSAAAGWPYSYGGAFSRMLQQRLERTFPDRDVEVVNVALTATNTYTLLDFAKEIVRQKPDAVLIYAGHNEYYGAFGVGSSISVGRSTTAVRLYLRLVRLRTVQLLRSAARWVLSLGRKQDAPRTLMERLAGERSITFDSPLHSAGIRQFQFNLQRLLEVYERAGIPVYVGTLASNVRDLPPFLRLPPDNPAQAGVTDALDRARDALQGQDTANAISVLRQATEQYPIAGDLQFAVARIFDRMARYDSARVHYLAATDRDPLPFRAPEAFNDVIREEATRTGAVVVDVERALAAHSEHGIIGDGLMLEHVHPNLDGAFEIADAFYQALLGGALGGMPGSEVPADSAREDIPVTVVDSLVGQYHIQRLTAAFPFQPPGTVRIVPADTLHARTPVEAIALDFFRGRSTWVEAQRRLHAYYTSQGRLEDAVHVDEVLAGELRFTAGPLLRAAQISLVEGDYERAEYLLQRADGREPTTDALRMMAGIFASRGDIAGARERLLTARDLAPSDRKVSLALEALGAMPQLEQGVRNDPRDPHALTQLGGVCYLTSQFHRARELATEAARLSPGYQPALTLMERLDALVR